MKKLTCIFLLLFTIGLAAQTTTKKRELVITQKQCVKKKGYRLRLKQVVSDSRCPEGVNCIWAGEAQVVISVYQNKKFEFDETLTLTSKNKKENAAWFSKYTAKKIEEVLLLPYPKEEQKIAASDYFLKLIYSKY